MAISIDFINISTNLLGKQTNNSDQDAIIRWPIVSLAHCARVAKLKINMAQENFILEFTVIRVEQCRNNNGNIISKSYKACHF